MAADEWSAPQDVYGEQLRYRVWMKKDRTLCLRMAVQREGSYRIDISDSCENLDVDIPEKFDIPDFPFDSHFVFRVEDGKRKLEKVGDGTYSGRSADEYLIRIFGYQNVGALVQELTGNVK